MEGKKVHIISVSSVGALIILIVVARITLKLSKAFFLICGAGIAVIIAIFAFLLIRRRYNQRRKLLESKWVSEGRELRIEYSFLRKVAGVPTKFRFKEIEEATDKFQALLGQGASASVFKGILSDGTCVAVKRISGEERGEKEFRSEVSAIASVQHVNLVRLLGYCCVPSGPRYLVYDFIPNGSLDCWIFPKKPESRNRRWGCLSWALRYKVAIDVAKAISYLHHDCRSRILHLDVKPENILLDENYRAIVADFGLSKLMGKDESKIMTTIRGTRGYLAPEWLLEHGVSEKTDIYSYGMVLLEMVGGKRNVTCIENGGHHLNNVDNKSKKKKWLYFPKIVNEKMREGKLMEVVDQRLIDSGGIDEREVQKLVYVALWCIQEKARIRPNMRVVVEMLEGRVTVEEPPDTQMVIVDLLSIDEDTPAGRHERPRRKLGNALNCDDLDHSNEATSSTSYSLAMSVLSAR
ncbi:hypothetical protein FNV43_RR16032 [Rhamnella rubrinervis]|uniref:Protein kinase domain-containing protein n=1 Tax=Rhamnella rubrinervis TaxID=2594499 RepID=A0A8K0E4L3_9ROSA|nr:hypothetical protein FNV43_RR16032 [Rhamnella rubrinervis]